jgi:hypothetical protein
MGHSCNVPAASGSKRISWRCPDCRQTWDYVPNSTPTVLDAAVGNRAADGSELTWWGGKKKRR